MALSQSLVQVDQQHELRPKEKLTAERKPALLAEQHGKRLRLVIAGPAGKAAQDIIHRLLQVPNARIKIIVSRPIKEARLEVWTLPATNLHVYNQMWTCKEGLKCFFLSYTCSLLRSTVANQPRYQQVMLQFKFPAQP